MKIATWNINSVRLRLNSVVRFLEAEQPDVLCLQETKVQDHDFPIAALHAAGYNHTIFSGEKSYNGVALISRVPLKNVQKNEFAGKQDKRHISAELPCGAVLHNFYVPAGGDIPDRKQNVKFGHKLDFVDGMREWFSKHASKKAPMILVGDLNIAPLEHDVWSHKQLLDVVSHTPIEVEKLTRMKENLGWVDASRHFVPHSEKLYSWWSYRNQDWKKSDRGRRLDHIWVTEPLQKGLSKSTILKEMRDWEQPSDHVPVVLEIAV